MNMNLERIQNPLTAHKTEYRSSTWLTTLTDYARNRFEIVKFIGEKGKKAIM